MTCNDLPEFARLFVTSARLTNVQEGLQKLMRNEPLDAHENESLGWAEDLWGQLDWDSPSYKSRVDMCVMATTLRPYFFQALIREGVPYSQEALDKIGSSLQPRENKPLSSSELGLASRIFGYIGNSVFTRLSSENAA